MQLLVSVRSASEARTALQGGAQIIDAKEPAAGALGPVTPGILADIRSAVPDEAPLSAALGDLDGEPDVERCLEAIRVPLAFLKLGFRGISDPASINRLLVLAVKLAAKLPGGPSVIAVSYADWRRTQSLEPACFPGIIGRSGAHGLLIDTAIKESGGLFDFLSTGELTAIGAALHQQASLYALAGSLGPEQVTPALNCGADILGVRGAVTEGGRNGNLDVVKVDRLARLLQLTPLALAPESP